MRSLLFFLALTLGTGFLGGAITQKSLVGWYDLLQKPAGNPPNWVFGPVWTLLYILIAVAVWRIWRLRKEKNGNAALLLFSIQFLLNAVWTPVFFGLRNPALGLAVILLMWVFIGLTRASFAKRDKIAGALFLPYWAWVTYAAWLNAGIWWLNR